MYGICLSLLARMPLSGPESQVELFRFFGWQLFFAHDLDASGNPELRFIHILGDYCSCVHAEI